MRTLVRNHIDPFTGEVNCTGLAEQTCYMMDAFDRDNIPEIFFELAVEFDNNKI
jgi:hypothetical protein